MKWTNRWGKTPLYHGGRREPILGRRKAAGAARPNFGLEFFWVFSHQFFPLLWDTSSLIFWHSRELWDHWLWAVKLKTCPLASSLSATRDRSLSRLLVPELPLPSSLLWVSPTLSLSPDVACLVTEEWNAWEFGCLLWWTAHGQPSGGEVMRSLSSPSSCPCSALLSRGAAWPALWGSDGFLVWRQSVYFTFDLFRCFWCFWRRQREQIKPLFHHL